MEKKIIKIKFRGIDDWNRPVYKLTTGHTHVGSTDTLFDFNEKKEVVDEYFEKNIGELCFFGMHFNCEPNRASLSPHVELKIIK